MIGGDFIFDLDCRLAFDNIRTRVVCWWVSDIWTALDSLIGGRFRGVKNHRIIDQKLFGLLD